MTIGRKNLNQEHTITDSRLRMVKKFGIIALTEIPEDVTVPSNKKKITMRI